MRLRDRVEASLPALGKAGICLSGVGVLASMYVCLVRVPSLAETKLDELLGTLLATAVSLLFIILAFLVQLVLMASQIVRQATVPGRALGQEATRQAGHDT